jgi:hypothetical protein
MQKTISVTHHDTHYRYVLATQRLLIMDCHTRKWRTQKNVCDSTTAEFMGFLTALVLTGWKPKSALYANTDTSSHFWFPTSGSIIDTLTSCTASVIIRQGPTHFGVTIMDSKGSGKAEAILCLLSNIGAPS